MGSFRTSLLNVNPQTSPVELGNTINPNRVTDIVEEVEVVALMK